MRCQKGGIVTKTLVYGAGGVGLGIASFLLKAGGNVTMISRPATVASLKNHGLARSGLFGNFHAPSGSFRCASTLEGVAEDTYNYILVCTKSFDSLSAAQDLSSRRVLNDAILSGRTAIILFQNGWGNAEVFAAFFPKGRIFNARLITGFRRPQPYHVELTVHADAIHIGSLFAGDPKVVEPLCREIAAGGMPCEVTSEIAKDLWAKMLYNCSLNPLGAIFGVTYGILGDSEQARFLMNGIIEEVFLVMEGAGYRTHWRTPEAYQQTFYEKLVPSTYNHEPSTLQDLRAGKRTELDALNGAVIRLAESLDIAVPYNTVVYQMLKFLETRSAAAA